MKPIPALLTQHFVDAYGNNLRSVLFYGSSVMGAGHDLDILIILKTKSNANEVTEKLSRIKNQYSKHRLDLQLVYENELREANLFSLDAHGTFIIPVLRKAQVLFGDNPFKNLYPDEANLASDILQKIQYYIFKARRTAIGYTNSYTDTNPDIHRKKILKIIYDINLAELGATDYFKTLSLFQKRHPHVLDAKDFAILRKRSVLRIKDALMIYEKLYSLALALIPPLIETRKPQKFRVGDIVGDAVLTTKKPKGTIILCEGIPAVPERTRLMSTLSHAGFDVLLPRYKGSWESPGVFLSQSPALDIRLVCSSLTKGIPVGARTIKSKKIILIGSSFGGAVAIGASDHPAVTRVIALSPIIDFPSLHGSLETLPAYLKKYFPGAYRFTDRGWKTLMAGDLIKPSQSLHSRYAAKIWLFAGANDETIPFEHYEQVPQKLRKRTNLYTNVGHISFSKLQGEILDDVLKLL